MKYIFSILTIFFFISANSQPLHVIAGFKKNVAASTQRVLIDLGGDGVEDDADGPGGTAGITDTGEKTPNNSAGATGQAGDGLWWNNANNWAGSIASSPVNTSNVTVSGLTISLGADPGGTFVTNDFSMNFGGSTTSISDYPSTAVKDNMYFHSSALEVDINVVIPAGFSATVKFWGTRADATARVLEFRLSGGSYTGVEYNAANNATYTTAATFSGLTGTTTIVARVKSGSTFGHISVIDITLTPL